MGLMTIGIGHHELEVLLEHRRGVRTQGREGTATSDHASVNREPETKKALRRGSFSMDEFRSSADKRGE
jgi:hypothetical protein